MIWQEGVKANLVSWLKELAQSCNLTVEIEERMEVEGLESVIFSLGLRAERSGRDTGRQQPARFDEAERIPHLPAVVQWQNHGPDQPALHRKVRTATGTEVFSHIQARRDD
jgi:hypothetical protein